MESSRLRRSLSASVLLPLCLLVACGGDDSDDQLAPVPDADVSDIGADVRSDVLDDTTQCGDGTLDPDEVCDMVVPDGLSCVGEGFAGGTLNCAADCTLDTQDCVEAETCGDGTRGTEEECEGDDLADASCESLGFDAGALACGSDCNFDTSACTGAAVCGNGVVEATEDCDDGNTGDGDGCDAACIDEFCGDGLVQPALGEACDTGSVIVLTCDDLVGRPAGIQACDSDCQFGTLQCPDATACGNGVLDLGEMCDDANAIDDDGCSNACELTTCGNFALDDGESCDGPDVGSATCFDFGFNAGSLACDRCALDYSMCRSAVCGDGFTDNAEECDDGNRESDDGCSRRCVIEDCEAGEQPTPWWDDTDGDEYGDPNVAPIYSCQPVDGRVSNAADCDPSDVEVNPDAVDLCDGIDNDCSGWADEDDRPTLWYEDGDDDGYGDPAVSELACIAPDGFVDNSDDCAPSVGSINIDADEICDMVDNNCSGVIDDVEPQALQYIDDDGDGFGDLNDPGTLVSCGPADGYASTNTDCNDASELAYPGFDEICGDGLDNDCNDTIDDGCAVGLPFGVHIDDVPTVLATGLHPESLSVVGDFDGNGTDDLVIVVGDDSAATVALVLDFADEPVPLEATAYDATATLTYPRDLVNPGDLDGDGADELVVVRAPGVVDTVQTIYVVADATTMAGSLLLSDNARVEYHSDDDRWGDPNEGLANVVSAGDLTGDGISDLLVDAGTLLTPDGVYVWPGPFPTDAGRPQYFLQNVASLRFAAENVHEYQFEIRVANAGDVDGDTVDDVALFGFDEIGPFVALTSTPLGATSLTAPTIALIRGVQPRLHYIDEVVSLGDLEADGYDDFAIVSRYSSEDSVRGSVSVFRGPVSGEVTSDDADVYITGGDFREDEGSAGGVQPVGDVDGDGVLDYVVNSDIGWVAYSGSDDGRLRATDGFHRWVVAGDGTLMLPFDDDGDTRSDVIIGHLEAGATTLRTMNGTDIPYVFDTGPAVDAHQDGQSIADGDCDDQNPWINSSMQNLPLDGVNQDCAAVFADELDEDGDGYSTARVGGDDCDDQDAMIHPGATETCGDDVDYDCDLDLSNTCSSTTPLLTRLPSRILGDMDDQQLGKHIAAGDFNNDGTPDIVAWTHEGPRDAGFYGNAALIFFGPFDNVRRATDADVIVSADSDGFIRDLATSDLNADGIDDLIVQDVQIYGSAGTLHVFYGPLAGSYNLSEADAVVTDVSGGTAAFSADADLDGDGYPDLLVSSNPQFSCSPLPCGLSADIGGFFSPLPSTTGFGDADFWFAYAGEPAFPRGAMDTNTDGTDEIVVLGESDTHIFAGSASYSGEVSPTALYTSPHLHDNAGASRAYCGIDFAGNGPVDLMMDAGSEQRRLEIYTPPYAAATYSITVPFPSSTTNNWTPIDWDRSGGAGVVAIDWQADEFVSNSGGIFMLSAGDLGLGTLGAPHYSGDHNRHLFDAQVVVLGDVNSDGIDDFAVSAPNSQHVPSVQMPARELHEAGSIFIILGDDS